MFNMEPTPEKNEVKSGEQANLAPASKDDLRELLEKNLKWSQIIYEQNRRIKSRLLWSAIADWVRLVLILAPFVIAVWYLWPMIKDARAQLQSLLGGSSTSTFQLNSQTLDKLMQILPVDTSQTEQIKKLLK